MNSDDADIEDYIGVDSEIPTNVISEYLDSEDICKLAAVRELLTYGRKRLVGNLDIPKTHEALIRYYVLCMKDNDFSVGSLVGNTSDLLLSDFEAARELCRLLVHWVKIPSPPRKEIELLTQSIRLLYLNGSVRQKLVIETGFLEHAFEHDASRCLFKSWQLDEALRGAFNRAEEWASP